MKIIISYDFSSVYQRKIVSDYLLSQGFLRVQKSVFLGEGDVKECKEEIENLLQEFPKKDTILYLPICEFDFDKKIILGRSIDWHELKEEKFLLF